MGNRKKSSKTYLYKIDQTELNVDGVSYADLGKYNEALEYFNRAVEIEPNNFISYFNRASIKMHFGDIEGARLDFKHSEKLAEKSYSNNYSIL